ncbi:hypothetical protein [Caballeronia sp. ATUFL_M1_KS5A]|uniref:hypothetical protein n=1 Tax=Caballeronia sp. ATUFL_M1_KS5A TaxID=2921778 RepID=UPI0020283B44|nr:hypothetical protein [Caballeronia sp. ATUFL_M1_KS5A]
MNTISKACVAGALTAAALIGAMRAHATGILAWTNNNAGGTIQISDAPCTVGDRVGNQALAITGAGEPVSAGCWMYMEPNIAVTWSNGDVRLYNAGTWTVTDYAKTVTQKTPQKRRSSM